MTKTGWPTPGAIITQLQGVARYHRFMGMDPGGTEANKQRTRLNDIFNIRILTDEEAIEAYPDLARNLQEHGILAETPEGMGYFSAPAAKGDAAKMRRRARRHIERLLVSGESHSFHRYGAHKLPRHVSKMISAEGLDPDIIEAMTWQIGRVEFRFNGAHYRFETRRTPAGKKLIEQRPALQFRGDPDVFAWGLIQITRKGIPRVRVTKLGLTIGTQIPRVLIHSLRNEPLAKVVSIPGMEDERIAYAKTAGRNTQFVLEHAA